MSFTKNLNKLLLIGTVLAGGITNALSTELISPTPYAKTMAASIVDSFEKGKASRAFMTAMKSQDILRTGLVYICKKPDLQLAEQEFFSALNQVFSGDVPNVTDNAVELILKSAQSGYVDANDIVKVVSGGKTIAEIEKSFYPTLKMTIKQRLQDFIDESSSDEENSVSDEIQQLKSYLQIPESKVISLKDLRKRKARLDVFSCQMLVENVTETTKDFVLNSIKYYLQVLQDSPEAFKQSQFLYVLMRLLNEHPTLIDIECKKMLQSVSKSLPVPFEENYHNSAVKIYEWLQKNDEGILGEYHI